MKYAKLINNSIVYAPNPIIVDDRQIGNPPGEVYVAQGYKPVTFTDPPETEPGYVAVAGWTETEEAIVQTWTIEEITELDGDQAMQYLFGGEPDVE